jgi:hypothetical protein
VALEVISRLIAAVRGALALEVSSNAEAMDLTFDTVDAFERVPVLFGEWSNEDFESTIAVVVEPCGNCPEEEHCGHVFVVMRTVGHPEGRDFDVSLDAYQAERMGQALIRGAGEARKIARTL